MLRLDQTLPARDPCLSASTTAVNIYTLSSLSQLTVLRIALRYTAASPKPEIQLIWRSINAEGFFTVFSVFPWGTSQHVWNDREPHTGPWECATAGKNAALCRSSPPVVEADTWRCFREKCFKHVYLKEILKRIETQRTIRKTVGGFTTQCAFFDLHVPQGSSYFSLRDN